MKLTTLTSELKAQVFFDLDGVICPDHPPQFGVGDADYTAWLETVVPMDLIRGHVDGIITGRLMRYSQITEKWLAKHGITFGEIHFKPNYMQGVDKTPAYKAGVYRQSKAGLYVESSAMQAERIAAISQKPVLCTENNALYSVFQRG